MEGLLSTGPTPSSFFHSSYLRFSNLRFKERHFINNFLDEDNFVLKVLRGDLLEVSKYANLYLNGYRTNLFSCACQMFLLPIIYTPVMSET